jgi:hypothetical protein
MKIDFNNVRAQACFAYDRLTKILNHRIIKQDDCWCRPNDVSHGHDINIKGYVVVDAEDIQECMDDLRRLIGAIAMTYEPDEPDFADVFEKEYPEPKTMEQFNEQE